MAGSAASSSKRRWCSATKRRGRSSASASRSTPPASVSGYRSNLSAPTRTARRPAAGTTTCARTCEFFGTPPVDGALCDYVTIGAAFAHPVPDTVSDDAAALCEPLSVGIAAVRKAGVGGGSRVLVAGAGPIGIVVVQVASRLRRHRHRRFRPGRVAPQPGAGIGRHRGARPHGRRAGLRVRRVHRCIGRARRGDRRASARYGPPGRWCWSAREPSRWNCRRS